MASKWIYYDIDISLHWESKYIYHYFIGIFLTSRNQEIVLHWVDIVTLCICINAADTHPCCIKMEYITLT